VEAVRARVNREGWISGKFPSRKQSGKTQTRVYIKHLKKNVKRKLLRWLRNKDREEQNLAPHPGGLVVRADDGRVKIDAERAKQLFEKFGRDVFKLGDAETVPPAAQRCFDIWALYGRREAPGYEWVFEQLIDKCPFCQRGKMAFTHRGFSARYKSARCEQCRQTLSYSSVRRACDAMPPMLATASRLGWNAAANKHIYMGRIQRGEFRNAIVVGDHHVTDVFVWDPRNPWRNDGEPRVKRYWLSAWQDEATGIVEFALGERPNTRLLMDALYRYALRAAQLGGAPGVGAMPVAIRTDNGRDYLSKEFLAFWRAAGIEFHHKSLPSCRTGESHGKSKVIERWFGLFERGFIKSLPGWCGSHPKEKPDDVIWPLMQQQKEFLQSRDWQGAVASSPLLTVDAFERKCREFLEGVYHRREGKRLNQSPLDAFASGTAPLRTIQRDALAVLMLHPESRFIHANGVSVNGLNYWHSDFPHYKGETCEIRVDFDDLSSVICIVGKERRVLTAQVDDMSVRAAAELGEATEENHRRVKARKKADREVIRSFFSLQADRLAGRRPWDVILEEKAALAPPLERAVNGSFTGGGAPTIPIVTEAHQIAREVGRAKPAAIREVPPPTSPDGVPFFEYQWQRDEWEREHRKEKQAQ